LNGQVPRRDGGIDLRAWAHAGVTLTAARGQLGFSSAVKRSNPDFSATSQSEEALGDAWTNAPVAPH
jgi:hypothetical protein